MSIVDKFSGFFADLIGPRHCYFCGATGQAPACAPCAGALPWNDAACGRCALPLVTGGSGVCGDCARQPPPQDHGWTAFRYRAPLPGAIVKLKFRGELMPAHVLGELMAQRLAARAAPLPQLLIPVPLHAGRLRRRGYNQALELARYLSRRLSLPLRAAAAHRTRPTREQTALAAAERRRNVRGVFSVAPAVSGRHIALLDDVITTGATVAELARTARRAGAARIEVWAAARA